MTLGRKFLHSRFVKTFFYPLGVEKKNPYRSLWRCSWKQNQNRFGHFILSALVEGTPTLLPLPSLLPLAWACLPNTLWIICSPPELTCQQSCHILPAMIRHPPLPKALSSISCSSGPQVSMAEGKTMIDRNDERSWICVYASLATTSMNGSDLQSLA